MRKNRVIEQNRCYHLVSWLAHRAFFLDDEEKDRAVALMRRVEAGVQDSMSYCINKPFCPMKEKNVNYVLDLFVKAAGCLPICVSGVLSVCALILITHYVHIATANTSAQRVVFFCAMFVCGILVIYRVFVCAVVARVRHARFSYEVTSFTEYERSSLFCLVATNPIVLALYVIVSCFHVRYELVTTVGVCTIVSLSIMVLLFHVALFRMILMKIEDRRTLLALCMLFLLLSMVFYFLGGLFCMLTNALERMEGQSLLIQ